MDQLRKALADWFNARTKKQKAIIIGVSAFIILAIVTAPFRGSSQPPLPSNAEPAATPLYTQSSEDRTVSSSSASESPAPQPTASTTGPINVENSEEFARLLSLDNATDPFVGEFAERYKGREIEFDGHLAYVGSAGEGFLEKGLTEVIINVGDYDLASFPKGPIFILPKSIAVDDFGTHNPVAGTNLHVIAKIERFEHSRIVISAVNISER